MSGILGEVGVSDMFGVVGGRRQAKGWADPWRMADRSDLPTPVYPRTDEIGLPLKWVLGV